MRIGLIPALVLFPVALAAAQEGVEIEQAAKRIEFEVHVGEDEEPDGSWVFTTRTPKQGELEVKVEFSLSKRGKEYQVASTVVYELGGEGVAPVLSRGNCETRYMGTRAMTGEIERAEAGMVRARGQGYLEGGITRRLGGDTEVDPEVPLLSFNDVALLAPLLFPEDGTVALDWIEFPNRVDDLLTAKRGGDLERKTEQDRVTYTFTIDERPLMIVEYDAEGELLGVQTRQYRLQPKAPRTEGN